MIDLITQSIKLHSAHIKRLADRNFGIGCDQVITIEPPIRSNADFYYRIFNADGQEVEQCGNGARCAAKFFIESGLTGKENLKADCLAGPIELIMHDTGMISATLEFKAIPDINEYNLDFIQDAPKKVYALSLGNPHGICFVDDCLNIPIEKLGKKISSAECFPDSANISFIQIIDNSRLRAAVFERGVGPTLACGSGACAAVLVAHKVKHTKNSMTVMFPHGELKISLNENSITMTGPASSIFIGRFRI